VARYTRREERSTALRHRREIVYRFCDTEPPPRNHAPRRECRLDLGGQADGPNGGTAIDSQAEGSEAITDSASGDQASTATGSASVPRAFAFVVDFEKTA
jgi:hypothetical protein